MRGSRAVLGSPSRCRPTGSYKQVLSSALHSRGRRRSHHHNTRVTAHRRTADKRTEDRRDGGEVERESDPRCRDIRKHVCLQLEASRLPPMSGAGQEAVRREGVCVCS